MAFSLWIIEERKFEMKKYLLLTGLLAVLTFNSAQADDWYYKDGKYYRIVPQYQQSSTYQEPSYQMEQPRYRKMTNADARRYEEKQVYRDDTHKYNTKFILGIDGIASEANFKKNAKYEGIEFSPKDVFDKDYKALGIRLGIKPHDELSIEAFLDFSGEESKNVEDAKISAKYMAAGADLILHMHASQEFDILFALGLAEYFFDYKIDINNANLSSFSRKKDEDSLGARLGLGFQFNLSDNWAVRWMGRYIPLIDNDYADHLTEFSLGLRYMF